MTTTIYQPTPPHDRRLQAAGDNTSLLVCKCVDVLCRSEVKKIKHKALDYLTRIYKAVLTTDYTSANIEHGANGDKRQR